MTRTRIEILVLDCCTTVEKIQAAIVCDLDEALGEASKVTLLKINPREQQRAVVDMQETAVLKLIAGNRMKAGWVNCHIRR